MTSYAKTFATYKAKAGKAGVTWPSDKTFEQAGEFVRPGTDRHVAAALMLSGKPTMEQVEAVLGQPHYNVVTMLKRAGCKPVTGTDREGSKLYAFTLPTAKKAVRS